jgi:hypothetical protein
MAFAIQAGLIAERCPPVPPTTFDGLDDWPGDVEGERGGIWSAPNFGLWKTG